LYERGIRRRLAPMLGRQDQIKMSYSLLFSLPGAPVIRYGEELGMGDDLTLTERLAVRTPMQWDSSKNAGFTTSSKPFRPVISFGEFGYQNINVSKEISNPESLLNFLKQLSALRKLHPEIGLGEWTTLKTDSKVFLIKYRYGNKTLITAHNFSPHSQQFSLAQEVPAGHKLEPLISTGKNLSDQNKLLLKGFGFEWFKLLAVQQ